MPPYTHLRSTTLLFVLCLLSRTLRTLWIQNPAFIEQCILQRPIFSVPGHPTGCTCGIGTSMKFGDRILCILRSFFSKLPCKQCSFYKFCQSLHLRNSCWVLHSSSMPRWVPPSNLPKDWRIPSARKGSWAVGHPPRTSRQRISWPPRKCKKPWRSSFPMDPFSTCPSSPKGTLINTLRMSLQLLQLSRWWAIFVKRSAIWGALIQGTRSFLAKRQKVPMSWGKIPAGWETFLRKQEKTGYQRK